MIRNRDVDFDAAAFGLPGARRLNLAGVAHPLGRRDGRSSPSSPSSTRHRSAAHLRAAPAALRVGRRRRVRRSARRSAAPGSPANPTCGRSRSRRGPGTRSSTRRVGSRSSPRALGVRSLDRCGAPDRLGLDDARAVESMRRRTAASPRSSGSRRSSRTRRSTSSPTLVPDARLPDGGRRRDYPAFMWLALRRAALASTAAPARSKPSSRTRSCGTSSADSSASSSPTDPICTGCRSGRCAATTTSTAATATSPTRTSSPRSRDTHRELASRPGPRARAARPGRSRFVDAPRSESRCSTPTAKSSPRSSRPSPATTRVDKTTGEIRTVAHEADAALHFQGDGETRVGHQVRPRRRPHAPTSHGRIILDVEWVPTAGGEARTAMDCFTRLAPHIAGAQGVIYDTALRGVHHQHAAPRSRPPSRSTGSPPRRPAAKKPRRKGGEAIEKSAYIEDKTITLAERHRPTVSPLRARWCDRHRRAHRHRRPALHRRSRASGPTATADKNGKLPLVQRLPTPRHLRRQAITVRLHGNAEDAARKLNRTENVRPIPPADPDFERLYPRRNDAESHQPRTSTTRLWLRRAHSLGHARQHVNLLGYALMVNAPRPAPTPRSDAPAARRLTTARSTAPLADYGAPRPGVVRRQRRHEHADRRPRARHRPILSSPAPGFLPRFLASPALVAQGIEHRFPKRLHASRREGAGHEREAQVIAVIE